MKHLVQERWSFIVKFIKQSLLTSYPENKDGRLIFMDEERSETQGWFPIAYKTQKWSKEKKMMVS